MVGVSEFVVGEDYTNDQIRFSLAVENLGGIRPSLDARGQLRHVAVLTASHDSGKITSENPYHDRIEHDILIYTAQGREGDQRLTGRNKRLTEQYLAPVPIYGFMNLGQQRYRFLGLLELLRHYPEVQADRRGTLRRVWLFEFRMRSDARVVPVEHASALLASILSESRSGSSPELEREIAELELDESQTGLRPYEVEAVRAQLLQVSPHGFEHLVRGLMEASGFRDGVVTKLSGDGGIDIDAYVDDSSDFFAGTHVQAQVKRWRHSVGSVEINNFRGALSASAKGVFITTSHYTRAAVAESQRTSKLSVTLIDGVRLSSLVLRSGLDVNRFKSEV